MQVAIVTYFNGYTMHSLNKPEAVSFLFTATSVYAVTIVQA